MVVAFISSSTSGDVATVAFISVRENQVRSCRRKKNPLKTVNRAAMVTCADVTYLVCKMEGCLAAYFEDCGETQMRPQLKVLNFYTNLQ